MKIALYHNTPSGGAKRAIYEWTRRLADKHAIDVYSLSTADHEYCDIRPYVRKYEVLDFQPRKLFKRPFGRLDQFQRWRDLVDLERINRRIADEINIAGYDIVFANTCIFTHIPVILKYCEIPSVYYLHEPFGPAFIRNIKRPYLQNDKVRKAVDRYDPLIRLYYSRMAGIQLDCVTRTSCLLANSQFTQERIQKAYGVQSEICPYGVDIDGFQPLPGVTREDYVLSVGEMSARKGFDFVVESLGRIPPEQRPTLKLACNKINKKESNYINKFAIQCGVDLQIHTNLGTDELRQLYNRARLCVYGPVLEPFGLVPLEAMACGTPVVGVREGGVQESVIHQETGLLVERDPTLFGEAIWKLLLNPQLADQYGRNGRDHVVRNWTWDKSVSNLESHLERCKIREGISY